MVFIYSLKLANNKYYIGKTGNPNFRLENHFDSSGSVWTKKYKPIYIHRVIPDQSDHDEQRVTQEYMTTYGIDNVRGGPWCQIKLEEKVKEFIQQLLDGENDKCYTCGSTGHYAKSCSFKQSKKLNMCDRCGRNGHTSDECYAKTNSGGGLICDELYWGCEFCGKEFDSEKGCLFHENVHCTKRRGSNHFDSSKALYDEMYESSDDEMYESSDDDYGDLSFNQKITCYRCGRGGHKSTRCYATRHIKGYYLE